VEKSRIASNPTKLGVGEKVMIGFSGGPSSRFLSLFSFNFQIK
jgi:hypothetical protein